MRQLELRRQIFHLTNAIIILVLLQRLGKPLGTGLIIASALGLILSIVHSKICEIPLANRLLALLEREENMNLPGKGAIFYGFSVGITILIFDIQAAKAGISALGFGDAFSTLIGKTWGQTPIPWNEKLSLEGSLAFVLATTILGSAFLSVKTAFISGLVGALVETLPLKIDDNITIPITVALWVSLSS